MKVSVNDRLVSEAPVPEGNLRELLDRLRAEGDIPPDEVVLQLRVDGQTCTAEDLDREGSPALGGAEVAVETGDLRTYASAILKDVSAMAGVVRQAVPRVAEALRDGDAEEANADLFRLLEAVQKALTMLYQVQHTCDLRCGPARDGEPLVDGISRALDRVEAAQNGQDWAAAARALEHGLLPAVARFEPAVEMMRDEL